MFTFEMSKQSNDTTIMNTPTIKLSEESKGLIALHLSNGHSVNMTTDQLEAFVEKHHMNTESCGSGLVCDPSSCEYDVETPVSEWLDVEANWDLACAEYYMLVILGVSKMNAQEKPNGSLSNQDVVDIIQGLDELIKSEARKQRNTDFTDVNYTRSLAREIAYMKARNLILSKI